MIKQPKHMYRNTLKNEIFADGLNKQEYEEAHTLFNQMIIELDSLKIENHDKDMSVRQAFDLVKQKLNVHSK